MNKQELTALAATKHIKITAKGYMMAGRFYPVANWEAMCAMVAHHDSLQAQIAGWLHEAAGHRKSPWPIGA